VRVLVLAACLVLGGGEAHGMTADGALLTNLATGTYRSVDYSSYEVSYGATALVLVVSPSISIKKSSNVTAMCSGETVTFCIWAVNNSALGSAFNVHVWDSVISEGAYVTGQTNWAGGSGGTITIGYYHKNGITTKNAWAMEPDAGTYTVAPASTSPFFLKWKLDMLGPAKSAMFCFKMVLL
jgi:hypothetical protein